MNINVHPIVTKFLEENVRENLCDSGQLKTCEAQYKEQEIFKLCFVNVKNF